MYTYEEYVRAHPDYYPVDVDGTPVYVGSEVVLICADAGLAEGSTGLVIGFDQCTPPCLILRVDDAHPEIRVNRTSLRVMPASPADDILGAINRAQELIKGTPPTLVFGNKVYTLSLSSAQATSSLASLSSILAKEIGRIKQEARETIQKVRSEFDQITPMPVIQLNEVKTAPRTCYIRSMPTYLCPFTYAPIYVFRKGVYFELSDKDKASLRREAIFAISCSKNWHVVATYCLTSNLDWFVHYHSSPSGACLGTIEIPQNVLTWQEALKFTRRYESTLRVINDDSPVTESPPNMPTIDTLLENAKLLKVPAELNSALVCYGELVEVIAPKDSFPPEYVGLIGKVVYDNTSIGGRDIAVEFLDDLAFGHTCDGRTTGGRGYWFRQADVRRTSATRRNHIVDLKDKPAETVQVASNVLGQTSQAPIAWGGGQRNG